MKYSAVVFDLDGTLVNSLQDLADATNYALTKLGKPVHEVRQYRYLVGQGLRNLIKDALGVGNEGLIDEGMRLFHEYYDVHMYDHTGPYEGVVGMLKDVQAAGVKIGVLSNKPNSATKEVVEKLLKEIEFDAVFGAREGVPIKPNPKGLHDTLAYLGVEGKGCMYVGDSKVDMLTGKSAGLFTVGVTWGFRDEAELQQNGADVLVHDAEQLKMEILGM
ncbi:HAD family hydrolase [Planctomycetota bacterium]|nr:HAD family hydrolase [Planctomycetota bacterium]